MNWKLSPSTWIVLGFIGCGAVVIVPVFKSARDNEYRSSCMSNLKVIGLACELYASDNGDKFPPLSSNGKGWTELISYKAQKVIPFSCPAGEKSIGPTSDYFYNARLARFTYARIYEPTNVIAFGDGMDNGPTNSHLLESPIFALSDNSYPSRHRSGANYVFADSHVQWLPARGGSKIVSFDPLTKNY